MQKENLLLRQGYLPMQKEKKPLRQKTVLMPRDKIQLHQDQAVTLREHTAKQKVVHHMQRDCIQLLLIWATMPKAITQQRREIIPMPKEVIH